MSTSRVTIKSKKFCKVCFDSNKPESMYTSHCVKSLDGVTVVCPTLLAAECRYCHKQGHTVSKCPAAKKHDKLKLASQKLAENVSNSKSTIPPINTKNNNNRFAALLDDDEDTEEVCVEEFPELVKSTHNVSVPGTAMNYKKVLAMPAVVKPAVVKPAVVKPVSKPIAKPFAVRSWADDYSSDEEEEEEVCNDAW